MIEEFAKETKQNAESHLNNLKDREKKLFQEKEQEIEKLKTELEELRKQHELEREARSKQLDVARTDKKKAMEAVMDYEKNWKAMMSTESYIKQV